MYAPPLLPAFGSSGASMHLSDHGGNLSCAAVLQPTAGHEASVLLLWQCSFPRSLVQLVHQADLGGAVTVLWIDANSLIADAVVCAGGWLL